MKRNVWIEERYTYDGQKRYAIMVRTPYSVGVVASINERDLAERVAALIEKGEPTWPTEMTTTRSETQKP